MSKVIGLTGGIASGKSTVSAYLQKLGAVIIDADKMALELTQIDKPLYIAYVEHFGKEILLPDGILNRQAIGSKIFADASERAWVNAIAQPMLRAALQAQLKKFDQLKIVIVDAPLLFEANWQQFTDGNCLVYVDEAVQLARLQARNNYNVAEALARIRSQMSLGDKKQLADWLIDNNGTLDSTLRQVDLLWQAWNQ